MKYVFESMGSVKGGSEMLALGEICFEGMGAVEKGGLGCWHWVECVLWAWRQLKRGLFCTVPSSYPARGSRVTI